VLSAEDVQLLLSQILSAEQQEVYEDKLELDFSVGIPGMARFRVNVFHQRGTSAAVLRKIPVEVPHLDDLGFPDIVRELCSRPRGLVLVTGPTGSGKSTTLAALVREILTRRRVHLITIEDPTEFEHAHGDSVVEHIELGQDTPSFAQALRAALRQDPDVILIGEMRDPESISIAITAAETGHLVLSTLHTGDAPQTIHRIIDSYPPDQISTVRVQLSISLAGIISQQLLPRSDHRGRVPAVELLMATPAVRNLIRQGKIEMIRSQITLEQKAGMLDLDRSLAQLTRDGIVDESEAFLRARIPSEFQKLLGRG
jgi:twitching motility protein PilT